MTQLGHFSPQDGGRETLTIETEAEKGRRRRRMKVAGGKREARSHRIVDN